MKKIQVHPGGHFLQTEDGQPFFYLGDTAWELFHRLNREDAEWYLRDRAAKGFTVIQAVVLAEADGLRAPNPYGEVPFHELNPEKPNEAYFQHVDWIVEKANSLGLTVGMLPTWGDKWQSGSWGVGPVVFHETNARQYGRWLGTRYRDAGIIWILGGDRGIQSETELAIIRALAEGLREGDGGIHLITFHPRGQQSSSFFVSGEAWLDFHMIQSGHQRDKDNYHMIENDYLRLPRRPVVDGEPGYDAHPNHFNPERGWLDQTDVRKSLYWALLAGAAGYTYGCHSIWQMWEPPRQPINGPRLTWREALSLPASAQVQHARWLLTSRPYFDREPAQWLLWVDARSGGEHLRVARASDGSYAMVYIPESNRIKVWPSQLTGDHLRVWWFNPRTGTAVEEGLRPKLDDQCVFQSPHDPDGRDWVLVLDDAARGYPAPGSRH